MSSASIVPRTVGAARVAATSTAVVSTACSSHAESSSVVDVPPLWQDVRIPANMKVWFSPKNMKTHWRSVIYLLRLGVLTQNEKESTHRIAGRGDRLGSDGGRVLRLGAMVSELLVAAAA